MYRFSLVSIVVVFGFLTNISAQTSKYKPVEVPKNYKTEIDVIYTKINTWEGRMDLYTNPSSAPTPIVINIHGGGWNHGVKESQTSFGFFFRNGIAVANVEYRLVDVSPAPAAIEDVRCALVYIFEHAKELNIDTSKIIVMGGSAGGHLALMTGLLGNDKKFDSNCVFKEEIKVAAIIDKYAPTDLTLLMRGSVKRWLGNAYGDKGFVESVSPIYHVTRNSPPTFIIHGTEDPIVPFQQSKNLYEKLKKYHVKTEILPIEGGAHGKFSKEQRTFISTRLKRFLTELDLIIN